MSQQATEPVLQITGPSHAMKLLTFRNLSPGHWRIVVQSTNCGEGSLVTVCITERTGGSSHDPSR